VRQDRPIFDLLPLHQVRHRVINAGDAVARSIQPVKNVIQLVMFIAFFSILIFFGVESGMKPG
jgi:hypothetical protein